MDRDAGSRDSTVLGLTVKNEAPQLSGLATPVIDEGQMASLSGTIIEPGVNDTITVTIDWGDGSVETYNYSAGTSAFNESHAYPDDDPTATSSDIYLVGVTATDDDGGLTVANTTVTVKKLPPVVDAGPATITVMQSTSIDFTGWFTDVGALDSHEVTWDFGDGGMSTGSLSAQHTFMVSGTFTVTMTVSDDDTGVGQDTIAVTVTPNYPVYLLIIAGGLSSGQFVDLNLRASSTSDESIVSMSLSVGLSSLLLGGVWIGRRRKFIH